jgi:hypothetical protein
MPVLAPDRLATDLHDTNSRLSFWLDSLDLDCVQPGAATPQQMAGLLSELMRAGEWLRALPREKDPALEHELGVYRANVERLRELLPSIQRALLEQRARLERERARVDSASEWARSSRQTL